MCTFFEINSKCKPALPGNARGDCLKGDVCIAGSKWSFEVPSLNVFLKVKKSFPSFGHWVSGIFSVLLVTRGRLANAGRSEAPILNVGSRW